MGTKPANFPAGGQVPTAPGCSLSSCYILGLCVAAMGIQPLSWIVNTCDISGPMKSVLLWWIYYFPILFFPLKKKSLFF